ncbi:MAG: hypothetical protein KKA32_10555 [Actinobacteria bacterium]|nr:hypothetical protein [Actinomycetota bacterium]
MWTRANPLNNSTVAVAIYKSDDDVTGQVKGEASFVDAGPLFEEVSGTIEGLQAGLPPVKSVIKITLESA